MSVIVKNGSLNDNCSLSILKYSPAGVPEKQQQHIYFTSFCVVENKPPAKTQ